MADYARVKGFADMFGIESAIFTEMEDTARKIFSLYVYEELRTPILESTALFQRGIGSETDVVKKEMFTFEDSKGRTLSMRPEATAGVMRAFIEAGRDRDQNITRLYTIGPMFRHERPQKGRMRQFHQINCECLGSDSPYADAEIICMLMDFLSALRIPDLVLKINSLGCKSCRKEYLSLLKEFLLARDQNLFCEDCRTRISTNTLRVLDCKQESCKKLIADAPRLLDHICGTCRDHMDKVLELLALRGIIPQIDHNLVRGLDYYTRTTFEVSSSQIGAQTAVAGGGRYDGLVAQLGGKDVPGIGFACGMERLALLLQEVKTDCPDFYLICMDSGNMNLAFTILENLREAGLSGEMNFSSGSFKSLMRRASKTCAKFCLILGDNEVRENCVTVKNMKTGDQLLIKQTDLVKQLKVMRESYQ